MTNAPQRLLIDRHIGWGARLYAPDKCTNEPTFQYKEVSIQYFSLPIEHRLDRQVRRLRNKQFVDRLFSKVDSLCSGDNSTPVKRLQNARIRIRQAAMKRRPRLRRPG